MGTNDRCTTSRQSYLGLALLIVVAIFNYIDRMIIAVLQVELKQDLGLSDTQLGALTGLSFALFYTTMALPIARLADRVSRKRVIVAALTIWSAMTAFSGMATGFVTLLVLRIGVAVGEAGCVPATHSMLSDYFPLHRRATAMSIWGLSAPIGIMLGFYLGGLFNDAFGWRGAFLIVGLSGVALAPVILFLLTEPRRGQFDTETSAGVHSPPPVRTAISILWNLKSFRYILLAQACQAYALYATQNWNVPFYVRVHGLPVSEAATYLGLLSGIGGGLGILLGGLIADRLGRIDQRWYSGVPAVAALLLFPSALAQYLVEDAKYSLLIAILPSILLMMFIAPGNATTQSLSPPSMRAFTSAILVMTVNILGMGLGPLATGASSDMLSSLFGLGADEALRFSMAVSLLVCIPAAIFFGLASRHLAAELPQRRGADSQLEPSTEVSLQPAVNRSH